MNIRLVTTSFNDEVHGTSNEKKTGCGINLLKSENVTRYHRGGIMTDLGEITCEKCKTRIAKDMIKSDQKEMKFLLKEEKIRAKKGIVDEGIVPLGNTTAKITREQAPAPAPRVAQKPAQKPAPLPPEEPAQINATIPGTGVAIDNSLAQFAINKPTAEPKPAKEDDFLAQFAVNKPQEEPEPAPEPVAQPAPQQTAQDDFLAQFAVPSPAQAEPKPAQAEPKPIQEAPAAPPVIDDISAAIAAMNTNIAPAPQPANEKPVQQAPAAEPQPAPAQTDDILSMFSIETPEKPASRLAGIYDNDASVIDVAEESLSAIAPEPVQQAAPVIDDISAAVEAAQANIPKYEAPVQPEPVKEDEKPSQEIDNMSEWDLIANQLFGVKTEEAKPEPANEAPAKPAAPAEKKADETAESAAPAPVQEAAPVIDDISAAINAAAQAVPTPAPVQEAAPVIDDISAAINAAAQAVPTPAPVQEAAPVIDDISAAINAAAQAVPTPA
ncbi:MAG: hypothetical protein MJ079_01570, partial [Ruminococcus sp.]|nr:hypothetical protein [Ruminococcus sp.]